MVSKEELKLISEYGDAVNKNKKYMMIYLIFCAIIFIMPFLLYISISFLRHIQ